MSVRYPTKFTDAVFTETVGECPPGEVIKAVNALELVPGPHSVYGDYFAPFSPPEADNGYFKVGTDWYQTDGYRNRRMLTAGILTHNGKASGSD